MMLQEMRSSIPETLRVLPSEQTEVAFMGPELSQNKIVLKVSKIPEFFPILLRDATSSFCTNSHSRDLINHALR